MVVMRSEIARLRDGLDRLEGQLNALETPRRASVERTRPTRYYEVLVGVYEHGRHGIAAEAFAELASSHGYQRRGLNGFFTGGRAALRRIDGRTVLTAEGNRLVNEHLRAVPG